MVNPSLLCPTYLKVASSVSGRTYSLDTWFVGKEYKFCAKGCGGDPVSPPGQFDQASPFPGVIRQCTPSYPRTAPGGNPRHGQMLSRSVDAGDRRPLGAGADPDPDRADARDEHTRRPLHSLSLGGDRLDHHIAARGRVDLLQTRVAEIRG